VDLVIRAAKRTDIHAVARIYISSWNAGFRGLMPERDDYLRVVDDPLHS
jgi:hypothetical protein